MRNPAVPAIGFSNRTAPVRMATSAQPIIVSVPPVNVTGRPCAVIWLAVTPLAPIATVCAASFVKMARAPGVHAVASPDAVSQLGVSSSHVSPSAPFHQRLVRR